MKVRQRQGRTRSSADNDFKAQEKFLMEVAKRRAVAQMLAEESVLQVLRDSLVVLQNLKELVTKKEDNGNN